MLFGCSGRCYFCKVHRSENCVYGCHTTLGFKKKKNRSSTSKANVNKFRQCLQQNTEELKFLMFHYKIGLGIEKAKISDFSLQVLKSIKLLRY